MLAVLLLTVTFGGCKMQEFDAGNLQNYKLDCDKWNEVKDNVLDVAIELGNYKSVIKDVAKADAEYWYSNKVASYFNTQYDSVRVYLMDRYVFLSEQLIESNHSKFLV